MSKAVIFFFESNRAIRVTNDIIYRRYTTIESIILLQNKLCVSTMHVIRHTDPPPNSDYKSVRLDFVQTCLLI